jgi:cytochrome c-type biogenesis protein CcmE
MNHKAAKVGLTALVPATALGVLLYTTLGESMQYYKFVDEVMAAPQTWQGKTLQVHGYVVTESIERNPDALEYKFNVQRNGHVLTAYFNGVAPDPFFKPGAEVVMTGHLTDKGFVATGMSAKCPSKYEAAPPSPGAAAKSTE